MPKTQEECLLLLFFKKKEGKKQPIHQTKRSSTCILHCGQAVWQKQHKQSTTAKEKRKSITKSYLSFYRQEIASFLLPVIHIANQRNNHKTNIITIMSLSSSFLVSSSRRGVAAAGVTTYYFRRIATTGVAGANTGILQKRGFASSSLKDIDYRDDVLSAIGKDESIRNTMAYSLAMSADISSFNQQTQTHSSLFPNDIFPPLNDQMREQLRVCRNQLLSQNITSNSEVVPTAATTPSVFGKLNNVQQQQHHHHHHHGVDLSVKLPRSLEDAISSYHNDVAIVVTETTKPFRVVNVNKAWEELCEYSYVESCGKSLGDLIQGPETCSMTITALMSTLLKGEIATAIITNYKKSGTQFSNRLSVGPIYDDQRHLTHFVGILQEV